MGQWPVDKIDRTLRSRSKLEDMRGQSGQFGIPVQEGVGVLYPLGLSEEGQQRRVSVFGLDYSCLILNEISGNGRKDE